jgi:hypothetical protein
MQFESRPEKEKKAKVYEENFDAPEKSKDISRRDFLKIAGIGLVEAGIGLSFPAFYEKAQNIIEKEDLEKQIKDLEKELSDKYGILIRVWEPNEQDRPSGIIRESLKKYSIYRAYKSLLSLKSTLGCYPPNLIKKNVGGIEIVHSVKPSIEGIVAEGATPEAVTSFGGNITIKAGDQDAFSYKAIFGEVLEPRILHHELAHLLTYGISKEEWMKLHPGVNYVDNEWVKLKKEKLKGFVLPYGAKSIDEDIATVAELLFINPKEIERLVKEDDILLKKFNYLKKWYTAKSNGEMKF